MEIQSVPGVGLDISFEDLCSWESRLHLLHHIGGACGLAIASAVDLILILKMSAMGVSSGIKSLTTRDHEYGTFEVWRRGRTGAKGQ